MQAHKKLPNQMVGQNRGTRLTPSERNKTMKGYIVLNPDFSDAQGRYHELDTIIETDGDKKYWFEFYPELADVFYYHLKYYPITIVEVQALGGIHPSKAFTLMTNKLHILQELDYWKVLGHKHPQVIAQGLNQKVYDDLSEFDDNTLKAFIVRGYEKDLERLKKHPVYQQVKGKTNHD